MDYNPFEEDPAFRIRSSIQGNVKSFFLGKKQLFDLPVSLSIDYCVGTDRVKFKGIWDVFSEQAVFDLVLKNIKFVDLDFPEVKFKLNEKDAAEIYSDLKSFIVVVEVSGKILGNVVEVVDSVEISFNKTVSDSWMRLHSDYSEAIVQFRFEYLFSEADYNSYFSRAKSFLDSEKSKDDLAGIVKIVRLKNGFDLWLGSKKAGRKLANFFSKETTIPVVVSSKQIKYDKVKQEHRKRFTFCIRFV